MARISGICTMLEKPEHFFKVMVPGFRSRLRIPPKFVIHFGERLSGSIVLRGPGGDKWNVEVVRRDGELFFENGWEEFVQDHSLELTDFLVFRYDGCSFDILIFDASGCEKDGSDLVRKQSDPCAQNEHGTMRRDDGDSSQAHNLKKRDHTQGSSGRKDFHQMYFSNKQKVPEEERVRARQLMSRHASRCPSLMIIMQPSHVNNCLLRLPTEWASRHLAVGKATCLRVLPRRKVWDAKLVIASGRFIIQKGWVEFVTDNNLEQNDICIFELTQEGRGTSRPTILDVTIHRAEH